jgi:hypothetical protein
MLTMHLSATSPLLRHGSKRGPTGSCRYSPNIPTVDTHSFSLCLKAVGFGLAVAAPVGPMSLLCMRRSLLQGACHGLVVAIINMMTNDFWLFDACPDMLPLEGGRSMTRQSPCQIELSAEARKTLEAIAGKYSSPYRDVVRAKVVLYAAQGLSNETIAARIDLPRQIVSKWRKRFYEEGLPGLQERPRHGRPPVFSPRRRRDQGAGL